MDRRGGGRRERCEETGSGLDVSLVGVDALDERDADAEGRALRGDETDVLEDKFVRDTRVAAVEVAVHQLKVDEEQVAVGSNVGDDLTGGIERGVHTAVETTTAQLTKNVQGVVGVHQRLAPTEGDAAATVLHDQAFLLDLGH